MSGSLLGGKKEGEDEGLSRWRPLTGASKTADARVNESGNERTSKEGKKMLLACAQQRALLRTCRQCSRGPAFLPQRFAQCKR